MVKALTLSGSIRRGSYNAELARLMGARLRARGAEVNDLDLAEFEMPMFNEDLEQEHGVPDTAMRLGNLLLEADAIFIATPEYNGGMTPLLTNTIAWLSRTKLRPFSKATLGLGAVSSGPISGMLSLSHLRDVMMKTFALIAPMTLWIAYSERAFDENGELTDPTMRRRADILADQLMTIRRTAS